MRKMKRWKSTFGVLALALLLTVSLAPTAAFADAAAAGGTAAGEAAGQPAASASTPAPDNQAVDNSQKMRAMHDKLIQDIATLDARREAVKAKMAVARTQQKVNEIGSSVTGAARNLDAFNRMEARADKMLDEANAMAELNAAQQTTSVEDLKLKYDIDSMSDVDDELAALKAQMGTAQQGE